MAARDVTPEEMKPYIEEALKIVLADVKAPKSWDMEKAISHAVRITLENVNVANLDAIKSTVSIYDAGRKIYEGLGVTAEDIAKYGGI